MAELKKHTSWFPTRKMVAVILSGAIVGAIQSGLRLFWPDNPLEPFLQEFDIWLQGALMVVAGYFIKDWA